MIKLIGMGPGSLQYVTAAAIDAVRAADRVIAFGRIAETAAKVREDVIAVNKVDEVIGRLENTMDIAILASGDPCFFGILDYLQSKGIAIDEVIPGLSSIQYMMAALKKSWHGAVLTSFHGRTADLDIIAENKTAIMLTDSQHTPDYISKLLYKKGLRGRIYSGFNLSYENELILQKRIGDEIEDYGALAVAVIENEMA